MSKIVTTPAECTANLSNDALVALWCIDTFRPSGLSDELERLGITPAVFAHLTNILRAAGLVEKFPSRHGGALVMFWTTTEAGAAIAAKYSEAEIEALAGVAK